MRCMDDMGGEIPEPDLAAGYLVEDTVIKPDATPIDDVEKFAYEDGDYERVWRYVPYPQTVEQPSDIERLASALENATTLAQVREAAKQITKG